MNDTTFTIISTLFWIIFGTSFVVIILRMRIYKILEKTYPKEYKEMGKPTVFWNSSPKTTLMYFFKFLWNREYMTYNNKKLESLGNISRILFIIQMVGLVVIFITMFKHMP